MQAVDIVMALVLLLVAFDIFAQMYWHRRAWRFSLPLCFELRRVNVEVRSLPSPEIFEKKESERISRWPSYLFRKLDRDSIAFHETINNSMYKITYFPLVRGCVSLNVEKHEISVIGYLS